MLELGVTFSMEQLVIDNDIIGMSRFAKKGIKVDDETIAPGDEGKWATVVCNAIGQYFHEAGDILTVDGTQTMVSVACAMDLAQFNA